jgi:hypothetical protein
MREYLLIIGARFVIDFGHYSWPFFIIAPGVFLLIASFAFEHRAGSILAIIGTMVATVGALLFQNTFDLFASWAYAWALVAPTSIGLAKLVYGAVRGLKEQVQSGLRLAGLGFAIFVFGALFFELGIGISGFRFGAAWLSWGLSCCSQVCYLGGTAVLLGIRKIPEKIPNE